MGPQTFNFAEAAELSLAAGASERISGIGAAVDRALALIDTPKALDGMSECALHFAAAHRGAAGRMADAIAELLPSS